VSNGHDAVGALGHNAVHAARSAVQGARISADDYCAARGLPGWSEEDAVLSDDVVVEEVSVEEGRAMLDAAARRWLGISGPEFLRQYHEGAFVNDDRYEVVKVAMMAPFGE
jgi:hypothetical protein